jgi:Predicted GTPase
MLIMDIRHPLKPYDLHMLHWAHEAGVSAHVILNKADKLSTSRGAKILLEVRAELEDFFTLQLFSAHRGIGLEEARKRISLWFKTNESQKTP